eukprot:jgi/Mesen1/2696/ME000167S01838
MAKLEASYACLPATQRGRGILIGGDPDKSWISYCSGKSVILRSLEDPRLCDVYTEHSYNTTVARFSPNGEWVASGDVSGQVRVWGRGGEHKLRFEMRALAGSIDDMQWSADGQRIVVSGDGKGSQLVRAFMWDSGSNVGEFEGHSKRVLSCSFRPTRPFRIASCGEDFGVNYYEGPPFRFKTSHREHTNFVNCVRYSPDGTRFITVGSDKKGILFDGQTGEKLSELAQENGHTGSIYAASWSPDGQQVLTVSADKTAKIWDMAADGSSGKVSTTFSFAERPSVDDMQVGCLWLPGHIITVSLSGSINYLSSSSPALPPRVLVGHSRNITALTLAQSDGASELYTSSYDGVVVRWRMGEGALGNMGGKGHSGAVKAMAVGGGHLVTCALDDTVRRSKLPAEQYSDTEPTALGAQPHDLCVAASAPELAIVATAKGLVLMRGSEKLSSTALGYDATSAALSPDGAEAAVGGSDGKLRIYRVNGDSLEEEAVLEKHRAAVVIVRYSPDGSMIASGDQKPEAVLWDRSSREVKVKNMLYHTARITCLAWAPDSQHFATGSVDTSVIVWDVNKLASSRLTIKGAHPGGVSALTFIDNSTILTGGDDACLRTWALPV